MQSRLLGIWVLCPQLDFASLHGVTGPVHHAQLIRQVRSLIPRINQPTWRLRVCVVLGVDLYTLARVVVFNARVFAMYYDTHRR